ncbi:probable disease resistance RPP8-like protein 2 [Rhodamnia argentea]|uniref:Probable disease resistance RPP8-like protein 2 n=1 Tax=Rhodamnia argentea TaxID=178133 RepID=A0A8B8QTC5_9MYRT|nr:probable disease resistance RPP8-like protein 2 [Rhodamnia argentea]XP_048131918.1 probable disease resistance RPP8-like protein 2 [Rhodamnia argentea]XP_048131919.1 probable disease resistance RPP8-like protein 2 [Rhodamnia argentea]
MAESVVSSVGQTLGKLLIDEAKLLWGVEGKVKGLQKELKLIQGFLRDADVRGEREQAVGVWVVQLQDIAYDAEDIIERYILRITLKKKGRNIIIAYAWFVAKCMCWHVHQVGTEIDDLKTSISNLTTRMRDFGIQPVNDGERKQVRALMPEPTYAYFEEDIVGREDSIKVLVEVLKDEKQHRVVSIWGMGGLGKTTLAKKVFAHDELKSNFDGFAWACVSKNFNKREILMGIFKMLIPEKREVVKDMSDQELFEALYQIQKEKRCIVFLDDIWTKQDWKDIRAAFPVMNTRSKVLITTRNKEVAECIDPHGFLYEPLCLSEEETWKLLMKRIFPKTEKITDNTKRLGEELLKKCGGLPLAVKVLGGLLATNEWEEIYRNINSYLGGDDDVSKVLALSYDDLAWYLKPCFLYLASFPEDEEILVKKVLHMWIAEGFVSPTAYGEEREITVEDVAKRHLMELANRGMVQVQFTMSGKLKTCHLHDVMRELCISKARQGRFLSILNIQQDHEMEECSSSMGTEGESTCKTRRLSLNMRVSAERNTTLGVEQIGRTMLHLRTLMFFCSGGSEEGMWDQFQPIFINCKFLRVLKLEDLSMRGNLPESVGDLVHLRFLSLAGSEIEGLPKSMGNLVCMEFLDLQVREWMMFAVPDVLWKLRRLRYLYLPYSFDVTGKPHEYRKKLRLGTLKNLRTLRNFCPDNCDVKDVGKPTNLQKLRVINSKRMEIFPQLAEFKLKNLQSSSFGFREFPSINEGEWSKTSSYPYSRKLYIRGVKIEKLPEHQYLPQNLMKLVLFWSELKEDPMPILEKLQHLVVLLLGGDAFVGEEMVCSAGGFPQLKHLLLDYLPNLEEWRVAEGAMPHLSRLGISRCPKLKAVPQLEGVSTYDGREDVYSEYDKDWV